MVGADSTSVCGSVYAAFPFSSMRNLFPAGCCWDTEVPERWAKVSGLSLGLDKEDVVTTGETL